MTPTPLNRARGALWGLALGDALGMPSQTLPRAEIEERYGRIAGFVAPFDGHPVSHGLRAAQVTDDTEQAVLLARHLVARGGGFDEAVWARELLAWEEGVRARGLHDLLGPSTKAALAALLAGAGPETTGLGGTTNGAAMRIAPLAIATPSGDPARMAAAVLRVSRVTHATREALAGAAAVAGFISAAVGGATGEAALDEALAAAGAAAALGAPVGAADLPARIRRAIAAAEQGEAALAALGTSVATSHAVPAAFGVLRLAGGDVWQAGLIAANLGDDTDTIGAIACAMGGACGGVSALPPAALAALRAANALDLDTLAERLLALRETAG